MTLRDDIRAALLAEPTITVAEVAQYVASHPGVTLLDARRKLRVQRIMRVIMGLRNQAVLDRLAAWRAIYGSGTVTMSTRVGEVVIQDVVGETLPDGTPCIRVLIQGHTESGETDFRIINPPSLVADPNGDVIITDSRPGSTMQPRKYREDSMAAIAEVVALYGGVTQNGWRPR